MNNSSLQKTASVLHLKDSRAFITELSLLNRVIVYALYMVGIAMVFYYDAQSGDTPFRFDEQPLTETIQELEFTAMCVLFFLAAKIFPQQRDLSLLLGAFFTLTLIRELNSFLGSLFFHEAWQVLALTTAAVWCMVLFPRRRNLKILLRQYAGSRSFGFLISGLLVTIIYSRLFGHSTAWMLIMEQHYMFAVKKAAEESIELLGDSLALFGAVEFLYYCRDRHRREIAETASVTASD